MATQSSATTRATFANGIGLTDGMMLIVVLIWGANFSIVKAALTQIPHRRIRQLYPEDVSELEQRIRTWLEHDP